MGENDQPTGGNPGAAEDLEKASLDTVYEKLATSAKGLASAEAKQRLEKYGRNELVEKEASDLERNDRGQIFYIDKIEIQCR